MEWMVGLRLPGNHETGWVFLLLPLQAQSGTILAEVITYTLQ
jgi:hypothetical protein